MSLLGIVYLILSYWAAGKTVFANSVRVGTFSALFLQQITVGFLLGFILIPLALEKELRKMVKVTLRIAYKSEADAKAAVVKKIYGGDAKKYSTASYADLFDSRKSNIYLKNLKDLINANWEYFKDYWNKQEMFISAMDILNHEGRFDAHATIPDDDEIIIINAALHTIEKGITKFKDAFS